MTDTKKDDQVPVSNKVSIIEKLNSTPATQITNLPEVMSRFKNLYLTFNGKGAERYYEAEKFHFGKILQENSKLQACTKLSLYGCFLDVAVNGLSFDPSMRHLYMVPFKHKVTYRDNGVQKERWEERAQVQISGTGELLLRMKQGQIKYADNPVLVYEGDVFKTGTRNNAVYLEHEASYPRPENAPIIACYVKITRNDDTVDYKVLTLGELMKIRAFSKDPNSKAWNEGLPGMFMTKTIKHAFRPYPKLRMLEGTKYTKLASEIDDQEPKQIDYTTVPAAAQLEEKAADQPGADATQQPVDETEFAETPPEVEEGITHDDDDFN